MRGLLWGTIVMLIVSGVSADDGPKPQIKGVRRDAPFHAYWAMSKVHEKTKYQVLLVTHGPIEDLAWHTAWSKFPLDNMAVTFQTYGRDSFWSEPFVCVQKFGAVDTTAKSLEMDGVTCVYEECPIERVVAMLDKPEGTLPIHRRENPLQGAENTARAFRLLLLDQLDAHKKK
jgi:hypothetical protein